MATREQFCDGCGKPMGVFAWNRNADGFLSCGEKECERDARDDYRAREDSAKYEAEQDGYAAYGGPGW